MWVASAFGCCQEKLSFSSHLIYHPPQTEVNLNYKSGSKLQEFEVGVSLDSYTFVKSCETH